MADFDSTIIHFPSRKAGVPKESVVQYRQIKSYMGDRENDGPEVVLATRDGDDAIHVLVIDDHMVERLASFHDTVGGREMADLIGETSRKVVNAVLYDN
ncbi:MULTISPECIES: hypothetical protein [Aurantimonas]|uniref:hypothetical protein n=1 Tax=Aurantimonas TaxID=182269 RepID=UPI003511A479